MPSPEAPHKSHEQPEQQPRVSELPPELANFLHQDEFACVTESTNLGTVIIIKMPYADIESIRGAVPIHLRHELFDHPASPVVRMVFTMYDQPATPLKLETFINVADQAQRADYAALGTQDTLPLIFYDETVIQRLSKVITLSNQEEIQRIGHTAELLLARIPEGAQDFELAKAAIIAYYPL